MIDQVSLDIQDSDRTLKVIENVLTELRSRIVSEPDLRCTEVAEDTATINAAREELLALQKEWQALFVWHDGPLVEALRSGDLFLVDEISLAEDSVLERLNSVLEPKRLLVGCMLFWFCFAFHLTTLKFIISLSLPSVYRSLQKKVERV